MSDHDLRPKDHADTIRRAINEGGRSYQMRSDGRLALDALLAERQQAIDALREAEDDLERILPPRGHEELAQGVYFAHKRIAAALLNFREQP